MDEENEKKRRQRRRKQEKLKWIVVKSINLHTIAKEAS